MTSRLILFTIVLTIYFFNPLGLNAGQHSEYSKNSGFIETAEESILVYLETNPSKSDSIALALFKQFQGKDGYAEGIANYYRGEAAYYSEKWPEAELFYKQAVALFAKSESLRRMASACNNLGLVYYYMGRFDQALEAFSQSLSIELKLSNEKGIAQSYQNMALMLEHGEQLPKAIEFYHKALDVYIELSDWEDAAGVYNNLAAIFAAKAEFGKAESYYLKALDIYSKQGLASHEAKVLCNIGALMVRKRNFDEGGKMLERALVLMKANGDKTGEISAYNFLGDLYVAKNEFQQAIFLFKTANELAVKLGSTDLRLNNLYSLYMGYKSAGLFEDALKTHEKYQALRDSFLNENPVFKQGILNQELERQLAERDFQNYKASVREKLYWTILIIFILLAGIIVLYLVMRRKKVENQMCKQKFGQRFIESQMDTHFVFSMLSSLQGHIISGNSELALDHLNNVAALLRKIFENTGKGLIPLNQEIDFLHAYFLVQKQRFSKDIGFKIESNIESDGNILVPFMVTKPFIESAITNGLFNNQEHPEFNIAFMRMGSKLEVTIEDNGPSVGSFKNRHLEERLKSVGIPVDDGKLFSGINRPKQYAISGVKVEDKALVGMGSGTRVRFSFPIVTTN